MATRIVKPITGDGWTRAGEDLEWRVTQDGIETRTPGTVGTAILRVAKVYTDIAAKVVAQYGDIIATHATAYQLDPRLVIATIVCESGGDPVAQRYEKHLGDYSIGLGQTLTATAYAIAKRSGVRTKTEVRQTIFPASPEVLRFAVPDKPLTAYTPGYADYALMLDQWKAYLGEPYNSIQLLCAYHWDNNNRFWLGGDPVFLAATYNSGSPRRSTNAWGLVHAASYLDAVSGHFFWASKAWREREAAA